MAERISALMGNWEAGRGGEAGEAGVSLQLRENLALRQVAAWPDTLGDVGKKAAAAIGVESAPGPGRAMVGDGGALLRIEPLKWWVYGGSAPSLSPDEGATLDLSHSRTLICIAGPDATMLINRYLPIDLREQSFPAGAVSSTVFHHVGVTLWRSRNGYELFMPRGFALSLCQVLMQGARQFGAGVS